MDKIAVLVPCYNESKTIEKVVTDWKQVLPEATIYVYDNNSTDDTLCQALGPSGRRAFLCMQVKTEGRNSFSKKTCNHRGNLL